jgi:hypothetical protein
VSDGLVESQSGGRCVFSNDEYWDVVGVSRFNTSGCVTFVAVSGTMLSHPTQ